ncbi:MAG: radical SAM protein [Acidobacteria bacterium]|nr:radical SAM protein [Acidobacteriota bacterium]
MTFRDVVSRIWRDNVLFSVLVELTYRCNLDCFFCYNDLALTGRSMRLADYLRFFDDLEAMQVMNLTLSGGEPLAHPDFFAIGSAARERGFVVRVKSNGHALRGEIARRLRDEVDPFLVEVSLHGACAATHERQTRVPGSFDRLLENLRGFRELGLRFRINSTLTLWNEGEVEEMYAIADSLQAPIQFDTSVTPRDNGDMEPLNVAPSPDGVAGLVRHQFARARARGEAIPDLERAAEDAERIPAPEEKHCGAGSSNVAVDPYGNVYPCVAWRVPAGNLHRASIREIWSGSEALRGVRTATVHVKRMLDAEGELGRVLSYCPGLSVNRTGRPDSITDDQRARGETILGATHSAAARGDEEPAVRTR